jgi:hypothetical protein
MPRNALTKDEMKVRVLNLRNRLNNEHGDSGSKGLAEKYLNEVLFIIDQYYR